MNWPEVVVLAPLRDTPCDARALLVGVAEVDPRPNACIDHFVDRLGETGEAAGEPAVVRVRPADAVGAEEVLERRHHRAAEARVARRMLRVRRGRDQRQPPLLLLRPRVVIGVSTADRGDGPPEGVMRLVVPDTD